MLFLMEHKTENHNHTVKFRYILITKIKSLILTMSKLFSLENFTRVVKVNIKSTKTLADAGILLMHSVILVLEKKVIVLSVKVRLIAFCLQSQKIEEIFLKRLLVLLNLGQEKLNQRKN